MRRALPNPGRRYYLLLSFLIPLALVAQTPKVLIDFNFDGRQLDEVHEPEYSSWVISNGENASYAELDVTFEIASSGFSSGWYKAGIQSPNYARLVSDGLISPDIELRIKGLPAGRHSLLTFHNSFDNPDNNTFSPIDIYVGDELKIDNLVQSNRIISNDEAVTAFVEFEVGESETAIIKYVYDPSSQASNKAVYLNGFKLNSANVARQAKSPIPAHADEHYDGDEAHMFLQWVATDDALSHDVYFGINPTEVANATPESAIFIRNTTDTACSVEAPYNMQKYYWRIDEIYASDTVRGEVWYFQPRQLAFDGAEGFGRYAIGGRGGKVVAVTNLDDSGPGSLRAAIENDIGSRTIIFNVSGIIELKSRLTLKDKYVTVAGQTAPGKGICISRAPFGLSGAEDCIIQNMRVRVGSGTTYDGMGMQGSNHCIIDHCSISWTIDESFSSRSAKNITLQRTLISEALNVAGHSNYPDGTKHGYAASISGDKGSFHHNLLAHCYGRNWSLAGGLDGNGIYAGRLDISNNLVYNFGSRTTDGGAHEVNFVNNYYKPGPGHQNNNHALNAQYDNFPGTQRYYFSGNVMPGYFDESTQEDGRRYSGEPQGYSPWVNEAFFDHDINLQSARQAYKNILSDVGCVQPVLDDHDKRIIDETINGTYTYRGSRSRIPGMPDSHEDVGGWEDYPELVRKNDWDSDLDGLPNWWEELHGLNINSNNGDFSDSNGDPNRDGITNLEDYLGWLNQPHVLAPLDTAITVDLIQFFMGYTDNPVYEIVNTKNGTAEILTSGHEASFQSSNKGLAEFQFNPDYAIE